VTGFRTISRPRRPLRIDLSVADRQCTRINANRRATGALARGLGSACLWRAGDSECFRESRTFRFFDQRSAPHTVLPLCCAVSIFTVCMPQPANEKLASAKAKIAWTEYCRRHDVSQRKGQTAGIEPMSGRVWIGNSIPDVVRQRDEAGVEAPLWSSASERKPTIVRAPGGVCS